MTLHVYDGAVVCPVTYKQTGEFRVISETPLDNTKPIEWSIAPGLIPDDHIAVVLIEYPDNPNIQLRPETVRPKAYLIKPRKEVEQRYGRQLNTPFIYSNSY